MLRKRYRMPGAKIKILIVDDDDALRTSLSSIFTTFGHTVRSAEDGFSALVEIRRSIPDVLLSDLNMPGMSGFELLSVFRRRFPAIQTIAMSGASCRGELSSGVIADAFFQKGQGIEGLMQVIATLAQTERRAPHLASAVLPLRIERG